METPGIREVRNVECSLKKSIEWLEPAKKKSHVGSNRGRAAQTFRRSHLISACHRYLIRPQDSMFGLLDFRFLWSHSFLSSYPFLLNNNIYPLPLHFGLLNFHFDFYRGSVSESCIKSQRRLWTELSRNPNCWLLLKMELNTLYTMKWTRAFWAAFVEYHNLALQ